MIHNGEKIVVVVGAGCSAEFRLPTGYQIMASLRNERVDGTPTFGFGIGQALNNPFLEASPSVFEGDRSNQSAVIECLKIAKEVADDSIDLFAFNNPSHSNICKFYSTRRILAAMYEAASGKDEFGFKFELQKLRRSWRSPELQIRQSDGKLKSCPNWLASLAQKYTAGRSGPEDLDPSALEIVTFNYDPIIEDALYVFITRGERFREATMNLLPRVHHVYGGFGELPERLTSLSTIRECAEKISYVNDDALKPAAEAVRAISEATAIYIAGFDMDEKNTARIGLDKSTAVKAAQAYDGNYRLLSRLQRIGVMNDLILSGTPANPMSIGSACSQGFFDLAALRRPALRTRSRTRGLRGKVQ